MNCDWARRVHRPQEGRVFPGVGKRQAGGLAGELTWSAWHGTCCLCRALILHVQASSRSDWHLGLAISCVTCRRTASSVHGIQGLAVPVAVVLTSVCRLPGVWDLAAWLMDTCTVQAVPECGLPAPLVIWGERAAGNPGVRNC